MSVKDRVAQLEKQKRKAQDEIILTVVYLDGARGQSYELTADGFREVKNSEVKR